MAGRIDRNGVLRVVTSGSRSQLENRKTALRRLESLINQAIRETKPRIPTAPPEAGERARLAGKRRRSEVKRLRRKVIEQE